MKKKFFSILVIGLILVDQLIKVVLSNKLPNEYDSITVINGVLDFTHINNTGAAFSILTDRQYILVPIVLILIAGFVYFVFTDKFSGKFTLIAIAMIVSGGIGNLIDRVFRNGSVFDYINLTFKPFDGFAVFNFADCMVVIGTVLLLISIFKNDFLTLSKKRNDNNSNVEQNRKIETEQE